MEFFKDGLKFCDIAVGGGSRCPKEKGDTINTINTNKMKIKHLFLLVLAVAMVAVGCKKDEVLGPASLKAEKPELSFDVNGGTQTFELKATRDWTAEVKGSTDGITVSPLEGKGSNDPVTVTVTVLKNDGANRTATIEFKASATLSATVTIKQDGAKGNLMSIADVYSKSKDADVEVEGVVAAMSTGSVVITDGTDNLLVYYGSAAADLANVKLGDKVKVTGKVGSYGKLIQVVTPTTTVISSGNAIERGQVLEITSANIGSMDITKASYISMTGVYSESKSSDGKKIYYNLAIEGTTIKGSIQYPVTSVLDELTKTAGNSVTLSGYFAGGADTDKNNMYRTIIVFDVKNNGQSTIDYKSVTPETFYEEEDGVNVEIKGTVMAKNQKGLVVGDASGVVSVYLNSTPAVEVGNGVTVKGAKSDYYGFKRIAANGSGVEVTSTETKAPEYGTPKSVENFDSWNSPKMELVTFKGTLSSGRYIKISGATYDGMLDWTIEDYSDYNEMVVTVIGYTESVNTNSKSIGIIPVSVTTSAFLTVPAKLSAAASETSQKIAVSANVDWTVKCTDAWIKDYTKGGSNSGEIEVSFDANTTGAERSATFTITSSVGEKTVVLTQAKAVDGAQTAILDFGGWKWNGYESKNWTSGYADHTETFDVAEVTLNSFNKQSQNITDCPVTKGAGDPAVVVKMKNGAKLVAVKVTLKQWGSKTKTVKLFSSTDGGATFATTESGSSSDFTLNVQSLPSDTNAFCLKFSEASNQVGLASIELTYKE